MPLLLRAVRQNRWFKASAEQWLKDGDVPADNLGDLRTTQHELSVFEVAADESNLERIVRAIAVTNKERLDHTGYVVFDSSLLEAAGIEPPSFHEGKTLDAGANSWHRDLTNLSGKKLVALTRLMLESGKSGTVLKKRLKELVAQGLQDKELPDSVSKLID